jgi:hypothetical protein
MNLKEEIRKIVQLQEIDTQIQNLANQKEVELPKNIENLRNELEEEKKKLSIFEEEVKKLQVKRKEKELELASKEENVKKAQSQLYQLKTNKEYQAKLSEITSLKADVSVLEEEIIKILDEIEESEKRFKEEKEKFSDKEKEFKEKEAKIKEEIKEIEIKIKNLQDKRNILIKDIDKNVLSKYEQLLKTRSGLAVVPVENENCGACHIRLTPQTINEIKMYKDLVFCENCVRMLYLPEDIKW